MSNIKDYKKYLLFIMIFVMIAFLTVGYSAFVDSLSITNTVAHIRADANTRVSAVSTSSGSISDLDYDVSRIVGTANIASGESVTFNTTITTYGNVPMALSGISVLNSNNVISGVSVTPNLSNTFIKICDNNICVGNKSKDVAITITNNTGSTINTQNFIVDLTFTRFYTVTYNDNPIGDAVLSGGTFTYTFASDTPSAVTVTSGNAGTPQISGDTLTIPNVTSDLVLTGTSGPAGSGTWDDPYQLDNSTYGYSNLDAGSYIFNDPNVKGNPKITVDENHKVTRYEMTGISTESGLALANETINTGVLAFDGGKITIDLVFTAKLGDSTNSGKEILAALSSTGTNTYSGFMFLNFKGGRMYVNSLNNQTIGSNGNGGSQFIYFSLSGSYANKVNTYTVHIVYDPSEYNDNFTITMNPGSIDRTDTLTATSNMANATITVGGNGISNNNMASMTVNSFSVIKG